MAPRAPPDGRAARSNHSNQRNRPLAGHPHFFNQLSNGLDIVSLAGEWLTAAANTNM